MAKGKRSLGRMAWNPASPGCKRHPLTNDAKELSENPMRAALLTLRVHGTLRMSL